jgi:hypothetical protein
LTNDPDLRQDLWLFFLEGNSPMQFLKHLNYLTDKQNKEAETLTYTGMEHYGFKEKL